MCFSFCGSQSKRYNRAKTEPRTKKKPMARGKGNELPLLPPSLFSVSTSVQHSRRSNSSFANHKKTPKKPPASQVSSFLATLAIWSNFLATFDVGANLIKFLATCGNYKVLLYWLSLVNHP